jgi:hypothetical protein
MSTRSALMPPPSGCGPPGSEPTAARSEPRCPLARTGLLWAAPDLRSGPIHGSEAHPRDSRDRNAVRTCDPGRTTARRTSDTGHWGTSAGAPLVANAGWLTPLEVDRVDALQLRRSYHPAGWERAALVAARNSTPALTDQIRGTVALLSKPLPSVRVLSRAHCRAAVDAPRLLQYTR